MKKRMTKTYSLPKELIERLREMSRDTDIPQGRIVERAVNEYLSHMARKEQKK